MRGRSIRNWAKPRPGILNHSNGVGYDNQRHNARRCDKNENKSLSVEMRGWSIRNWAKRRPGKPNQ